MGAHSYRTVLNIPGAYVIERDGVEVASFTSLDPVSAVTMRRICLVLDEDDTAERDAEYRADWLAKNGGG